MPKRQILGKTIYEAPRRLIAGVDCWLSEDERWIVAARWDEDLPLGPGPVFDGHYPRLAIWRWRSED